MVTMAEEGGAIGVLAEAERFTRLGSGMERDGTLSEAATLRVIEAVSELVALARAEGATSIRAVATSAARDADDRHGLLQALGQRCGRVDVITGDEEARLMYLGACSERAMGGATAVIDLGGGSTEIAVGDGRLTSYRVSLPLGCVRQAERHLDGTRPARAAHDSIRADVYAALDTVSVPSLAKVKAIGSDSPATSLVTLESGSAQYTPDTFHTPSLSAATIHRWASSLVTRTPEQILALAPRELAGREDVFAAGVTILDTLIQALHVENLAVTHRGLRHGVALDLLSAISTVSTTDDTP